MLFENISIQLLLVCLLAAVVAGCSATQDNKNTQAPHMNIEAKTTGVASSATITGHCHCGQVQYEAQGPITNCSYCDCLGCQRATGTFKAPFVTVPDTGFKITAGQTKQFRAASGDKCDAHGSWYSCSNCGSPIFWKPNQGGNMDIFAGTLDDKSKFHIAE